jgi:uncharacterized integral membrane protein
MVMNFPLDNPAFNFLFWLANTPGLGGIALGAVVGGCALVFAGALRWIVRGARADETAEFPYPTAALHKH